MKLSDIAQPIQRDLKQFRSFFRQSLRSENLLLDAVIRYVLKKKGKQVRPILVLLSASAAGKVSRRTYVGATLVELLHTATLIHDDVVDEAVERRGVPAVNAIWNNKTAVLVGDFMLAQGLKIANQNGEFQFLDITSTAVQRMSEGELLQTRKTRKLDIREEEYFRIISDKTASLIGACCEIGAVSTSDDHDIRRALRLYGEMVGTAFQIRDDIFDYTSTKDSIGKPTGNDIQEKKLTLPLIHALNGAPRSEARSIVRMIRKGTDADRGVVEKVRAFVESHDGIGYAIRTADDYRDRAKKAIRDLPEGPAHTSLDAFADFVVERNT